MASSSSHVSRLRPQSPLLVYLDLNKWIDLAHAETGTDKGKPYITENGTGPNGRATHGVRVYKKR